MWLMRSPVESIVVAQLDRAGPPPMPEEIDQGATVKMFGVIGSKESAWMGAFSDVPATPFLAVAAMPGLLALVSGRLGFRSHVACMHFFVLTQAGPTLPIARTFADR